MAATTNKGFGLLFEMGCGKTRTAIAIAGAAYQKGAIQRVLVIAPTSVVSVWPKEIAEVADFKVTCKALLGTKQQRIRMIEDLQAFPFKALKVAVINYESTWRDGLFEKLQEYDADLIICDESQRIKTHDAEQSKAIHKLGDQARYKLILSGTPVQNDAIDIWSQYRFLDASIFGRNFYQFRNRYAIMGGSNRKQIVGYKDLDGLIRKSTRSHSESRRKKQSTCRSRRSSRGRSSSVKGKRPIQPDQAKQLCGTIQRRQDHGHNRIDKASETAAAGRRIPGRRRQRQTGARQHSEAGCAPGYHRGLRTRRRKEAGNLRKVYPGSNRHHEMIDKTFQKTGKKQVAIYGAIKKEDRGPIIKQFQEDPDTVIIVGQIDTLGVGVTLTAADTCVYYSKNFNYATYEQSLSRIHRIGQRNTCTYIDLETEGTVDEMIGKALARKEDMAKTVVDDWRAYFE